MQFISTTIVSYIGCDVNPNFAKNVENHVEIVDSSVSIQTQNFYLKLPQRKHFCVMLPQSHREGGSMRAKPV